MNSSGKITFYSGVGTVTGSNFMLTLADGRKILIDCGLIQGEKFVTEENKKPFAYDIVSVDALIVTHAHLDHVGRIPKLVKEGFKGTIYSTPQTKALAELVLTDAASILAMKAQEEGEQPLYDLNDVQAVFPLWQTKDYHEPFDIGGNPSVTFKDAGHILGSSMVEFSIKGGAGNGQVNGNGNSGEGPLKKILFTGDLGNSPAPLLRDTEVIGTVDYLVMESVYGDRNHEGRAERVNKFRQVIEETMKRGGTLVVPTFSIDRTQVLLYELNNLVEQNKIPSVPIFVDSPMAIKATSIYAASTQLFNDKVQEQIGRGDDVFKFPRLEYTMSQNESRDIERTNGPKIILAGSGMSVGGRVLSHEKNYLEEAKNTILLVGYQTTGSLGRQLAEGAKKVHIGRETYKVKAHIETLYGYSAHKDSDHLVDFVATADERLKEVFVVMGEPRAAMHLAQRINDELGVKAIVPEVGKDFDLK